MVTKTAIESALKNAGVEVFDETPGAVGGWAYEIGGAVSGHCPGKLDAIVAGLKAAEELERLCALFNK